MNIIKGAKITDPKGYTAAACKAGFKRKRKDLCIVKSELPANCFAKFTKNMVKAAPVIVGLKTLKKSDNKLQLLVVNSGNANAGTGQQGIKDVYETINYASEKCNVPKGLILASSTGVIGKPLNVSKMYSGIDIISKELNIAGGTGCAEAIMTTDTVEKAFGVSLSIASKEVKLCGITKGSGMIQPNMATTLAFITTDVVIDPILLNSFFTECVEETYNMITVDGHMSTNDTALIMANGCAENAAIQAGTLEAKSLKEALFFLMMEMAKSVVKDGEGATKFVKIHIGKASTYNCAKKMAFAIANSPLVKTAIFGEDLNWGRILSAAGMTDVHFKPEESELLINGTHIFKAGNPIKLNKKNAENLMKGAEINIDLSVHTGNESATVYTSDLSYDYVKINAEYHT